VNKTILLMTPPYHTGIIEVTGKWPPLSLVYLAGHLRAAGFRVEIYDAMTKDDTLSDVRAKLAQTDPWMVMVGAFTPSVNAAIDCLKAAKEVNQEIITCLGGVHPTFCYGEILQDNFASVDFIVRGEGEVTAVELAAALQQGADCSAIPGLAYRQDGQVIKTPDRPFLPDLDRLVPAWDLLDWEGYFYKVTGRRLALIGSSRGCPHKCRFCSQHLFWQGTYRERSPESFVAEVEHLHGQYGVGMFMLADEYTTYNRTRWEKILDLLAEKNLDIHFSLETRANDIIRDRDILWKYRAAGIIHMYVGVETARQATLDYFDKNITVDEGREAIALLNNAGIITECSFILGSLDETPESIDHTLQTALQYNPDLAHFLLITPWPYTPLYDELYPYIVEHDYSKYHFVHPIVEPLNLGAGFLWEKIIECFKVFYLNKARQCFDIKDEFKKWYMLRCIQIMHQEFFVTNFGNKTIQLPREMGSEIEEILRNNNGGEENMTDKYSVNGDFVEELDAEIRDFIEAGVDNRDEAGFNRLALKEFEFQFNANKIYREYCKKQGVTPEAAKNWWEIPAIPARAFKQQVIASFPLQEAELALLTSGTSDPNMRGKIYRDKSSLAMILRSNYLLTKTYLFPDVEKMRILLLVPSPKVAPAMAMAFGLEQVKKEFGAEDSLYLITPNGFETDLLIEALRRAEDTGEPVALIGATSGYVHFFNSCRERGIRFKLPVGSRLCDGGGYQGTFGECSREEFYALCEESFGLPREFCINTLGMSESGTNYFDNTLRRHLAGEPAGERHKVALPWTRTIAVGPRTGQRMPKGEIGLLRHYDLTNRATVIAVQTDNLGYETDDGFEIIGRAGGKLPGFGLEPSSVKDWILAGHRQQAEEVFNHGPSHPAAAAGGHPAHIPIPGHPAHIPIPGHHAMGSGHPANIPITGHPQMSHGGPGTGCSASAAEMIATAQGNRCSTVADGMMKQGNPCSTVADEMMKQGNPCSTVADAIMKQGNPCSTAADEIMKQGNPCSTVADEMMKQGNPCSTAADEMMKQGNPCSTVADAMMKQGNPCSTMADALIRDAEGKHPPAVNE